MLSDLKTRIDKALKEKKGDGINLGISYFKEMLSIVELFPKLFFGYSKENCTGKGKMNVINPSQKAEHAIVLYHGYGMNENANALGRNLAARGIKVYSLTLPFMESIEDQARLSHPFICNAYEDTLASKASFSMLGYSMGGLTAKYYLSYIKPGEIKVDNFISLSSPHLGTFAAYFGIGESAKEMEPFSGLVLRLYDKKIPRDIKKISIVPTYDYLVFPPESAFMDGDALNLLFSRENHIQVICSEKVADAIKIILSNNIKNIAKKKRKFTPTLGMRTLKRIDSIIKKVPLESLNKNLENMFNQITGYEKIKKEMDKKFYIITSENFFKKFDASL